MPKPGLLVGLSFQHLFAMFGATVIGTWFCWNWSCHCLFSSSGLNLGYLTVTKYKIPAYDLVLLILLLWWCWWNRWNRSCPRCHGRWFGLHPCGPWLSSLECLITSITDCRPTISLDRLEPWLNSCGAMRPWHGKYSNGSLCFNGHSLLLFSLICMARKLSSGFLISLGLIVVTLPVLGLMAKVHFNCCFNKWFKSKLWYPIC